MEKYELFKEDCIINKLKTEKYGTNLKTANLQK